MLDINEYKWSKVRIQFGIFSNISLSRTQINVIMQDRAVKSKQIRENKNSLKFEDFMDMLSSKGVISGP